MVTVPGSPLELWGGLECTRDGVAVDRGDPGAAARPPDAARLAGLGLTTQRCVVPWRSDRSAGVAPWDRLDDHLGQLREAMVRPVVTFVQDHGTPLDPSWLAWDTAARLADFAAAFAARYPWIDIYTPIDAPLVGVRRLDDATSVRALLVRCLAVHQAMRAVRAARPHARLLQTEDAGRTYGTRALRRRVAFENHRRWLTVDLLCGRVDARHPLAAYLDRAGADRLDAFRERPSPPDLLGLDFHLTSDRQLDDEWQNHPAASHRHLGAITYADVPAVTAGARGAGSHARVIGEAWTRYGIPLVLSDVHGGAYREDQVRWLAQAWKAADTARRHGVAVAAVTISSPFGALTAPPERPATYVPGAFDVRGSGQRAPRPTAVAAAATDLVRHGAIRHPLLHDRPILLVGSGGLLGTACRRRADARGLAIVACPHAALDAANPAALAATLHMVRPWVVVNTAGRTDIDDAELDPVRCRTANVDVPLALVRACAAAGVPLVTFSSDQVFDGQAQRPYGETAPLGPVNVYGRAQARAEQWVRSLDPRALVVRTSACFGPHDARGFAATLLAQARSGQVVRMASDVVVTATYLPDLMDAVLDLAIDGASGVWHLTSSDPAPWSELGAQVAACAGLDRAVVRPTPASRLPWTAPRPAYSALTSHRAMLLPGFDSVLARFAAALSAPPVEPEAAHATRRHPGAMSAPDPPG